MKRVTASIDNIIAKRFLLPIQREDIIAKMGRNWDDVMTLEGIWVSEWMLRNNGGSYRYQRQLPTP